MVQVNISTCDYAFSKSDIEMLGGDVGQKNIVDVMVAIEATLQVL
jgi:hypothetical protein